MILETPYVLRTEQSKNPPPLTSISRLRWLPGQPIHGVRWDLCSVPGLQTASIERSLPLVEDTIFTDQRKLRGDELFDLYSDPEETGNVIGPP